MWISSPNYEQIIRGNWRLEEPNVTINLHNVMEVSKVFNNDTFGNIFKKKCIIKAQLEGIYSAMQHIDSNYLCLLEKELQKKYGRVLE
ncbi:hypothetical protein L6164_013343 [Bauhinia variegata]|uniref:Uncharacterized protein n=1 Tax=Bauhinia variegata TaxID=167791 RepID=A0ACB9PDY5_BAUVA|nr:hypothetical protein L6164_013343 [Bauhinia variegata]